MKKFRKSKINCYDVTSQILQFSLKMHDVIDEVTFWLKNS